MQKKIDDAIDWLKVPEHQAIVLDFAMTAASLTLPTKGAGGKVLKVLNTVAPFVKKGKK